MAALLAQGRQHPRIVSRKHLGKLKMIRKE